MYFVPTPFTQKIFVSGVLCNYYTTRMVGCQQNILNKKILALIISFAKVQSEINKSLIFNVFINMYGKEKIADAVLYGKDLKDRYTVLWLYYQFCK